MRSGWSTRAPSRRTGSRRTWDGPITEDLPALGHARHPYSAHKAEVEGVLADALSGAETEAWVFRPCIVAGSTRRR